MKDKSYSTSETVFILRQALGTFRAWDDCLADMRRNKTTVYGFDLKPACTLNDGRAWRPVYAWHDIKTFIRDVFRAAPEASVRLPVQGQIIEFDPSMPWWTQKIKPTNTTCSSSA